MVACALRTSGDSAGGLFSSSSGMKSVLAILQCHENMSVSVDERWIVWAKGVERDWAYLTRTEHDLCQIGSPGLSWTVFLIGKRHLFVTVRGDG
jgi:hypothetical protein